MAKLLWGYAAAQKLRLEFNEMVDRHKSISLEISALYQTSTIVWKACVFVW